MLRHLKTDNCWIKHVDKSIGYFIGEKENITNGNRRYVAEEDFFFSLSNKIVQCALWERCIPNELYEKIKTNSYGMCTISWRP